MFWKIIFALYSLLLFVFGWFASVDSDNSSLLNSNNKESLCCCGIFILMFSLFGILYGLARKIRTFSLKPAKFLIGSVVCVNLCLALIPDIYANLSFEKPSLYLGIFELMFVIFGILLLPLYIPFISYLKRCCTYTKSLKNSFFSVFTFFWTVTLVAPAFCYDIYELFKEPISNDIWLDVLCIFASLFVLMCFCGFILRKDFMPRKLMQWACIPLVAIYCVGTSYTELLSDIAEIIHYPVLINLLILSVLILELIVIYRYVYTNMTSDKPDYINVEPSDEKKEGLFKQFKDEWKQKSRVSKISYILILLFVGNFGVHKFYAGKPRFGVIYLLLCWSWFPLLFCIVDLLLAIAQKADESGEIEV